MIGIQSEFSSDFSKAGDGVAAAPPAATPALLDPNLISGPGLSLSGSKTKIDTRIIDVQDSGKTVQLVRFSPFE